MAFSFCLPAVIACTFDGGVNSEDSLSGGVSIEACVYIHTYHFKKGLDAVHVQALSLCECLPCCCPLMQAAMSLRSMEEME